MTTQLVKCDTHGATPGYVVCPAVNSGAKAPAYVLHPTEKSLGQITCGNQNPDCRHEDGAGAVLVCARCAVSILRGTPRGVA